MRKAMFLLAFFGLAGSLWAADPIIGTWNLNLAKSSPSTDDQDPKERTEVYREVDDDLIELVLGNTLMDGSSTSSKWTWPKQGGFVNRHLPEPLPEGRAYVVTLVEPGHWYVTIVRNGKQVGLYHKTISTDGKTMGQTFKGLDDQGKPFEVVMVFDKQ